MTSRVFVLFALLSLPTALHAQFTVEVNQAIGVQKNNARKFVAGKDTVIRALLPAPATVNFNETRAVIIRNSESIATISPIKTEGPVSVVDFLCPSRAACGNWAEGSYTFVVTVNGETSSTEGTEYNFVRRGTIRVLALPVIANYGGTIVPVTDERWKTFGGYVRSVYPVAADQFFWVTREALDASGPEFDLETDQGRANLWEALAKLIPAECAGSPSAPGCYAQVFGFIMDRPNGYPEGNLQGYTYGKPANVGVVRDEDAAATVAHEIGHTYGLGDTYDGGTLACLVNPAPDGFTGKDFDNPDNSASCTIGRVALEGVSGTKVPAAHHPYDVGGRGALGDGAEYMGSGGRQEQFWTTQEAWDWLFDKLVPEEPQATALATPQRYLLCFGAIARSAASAGDVQMDPCWAFLDSDSIPQTTGPYMLATVDAAGNRLGTAVIDPEFDPFGSKGLPSPDLTTAPFGGVVAFPESTAALQILRNDQVVRQIAVTPNAPVVTNVVVQADGTVTWDASDADGGSLAYFVEYNADVTSEESEWQILDFDLTERRLEIDFSEVPGGTHARMRVGASDGFNTGEAESADFVIPAKAPLVFIDEEMPSHVVPGEEIILDGDAFDLQDEDMSESDLTWSSNLDGVLGIGTPLRVVLSRGTHTITLTATNSLGLQGTARRVVSVSETVKRRSVRK